MIGDTGLPAGVRRAALLAVLAASLLAAGLHAAVAAPSARATSLAVTAPGEDNDVFTTGRPTFHGTRDLSFWQDGQVLQAVYPYPYVHSDTVVQNPLSSNSTVWNDPADLVAGNVDWAYQVFGTAPSRSLPDGHYTLEIRQATDHDGNTPLYTTVYRVFWVDTVPPDTTIDGDARAPGGTHTFTFHGTDPAPSRGDVRLECAVDGGAYGACTSPFTTPALGEGQHTFSVRAIDPGGNVDPTPATSSWIVDTTPPQIAIHRPAAREHVVLGSDVAPDYACTDPPAGSPAAASGIASCTDDGFSTRTLGPGVFTVHATDHAGNTATASHAYVVDPPRYADAVLHDGPLAYYRLGDPLGATTMTDSSGHGHDGTYANAVALRRPAAIACERRPHPPRACETTSDPQDWAAQFPARDGYGYANGIPAPQHAYTIEAWIDPADGSDMSIAGQGGAGQLFVHDGHLALRQTQVTVYGAGPTLTPGTWWHVAATWDGTTTRLFVNGVQVGSSTSANTAPSGTSTFYVGYGDQAPWFHGALDEVAYYDTAIAPQTLSGRYAIGTAFDHPSPGPGDLDTAGPSADAAAPANGGLYAPGKVPPADFSCHDPDGAADVASCTATVDGTPIADGDPLPDGLGTHTFVVTAVDQAGLTYVHPHTYRVAGFEDILLADDPIAYYRLGDPAGSSEMADVSGHGHDGTYKNAQESGPVGIAGDGDHARSFFGDSGYGYVNGIAAPRYQATLEAWVNPDDAREEAIAGHGDAAELDVRGGLFVFRHLDQTVTANVGPTPGHWSQVVGVWDGASLSIYVDGELHGTAPATTRPSSSSTFSVGFGELAPWFKGSIDEVAYYGTALSAARIWQHYLADPPPASTPATSGTTPTPASTTPATTTASGGTPAASGTPAAATQSTTVAAKTVRCVVPALRGRTLASARRALARAGCRLGTVSRHHATRAHRGRVLTQSVTAGTQATVARVVRVTVGR